MSQQYLSEVRQGEGEQGEKEVGGVQEMKNGIPSLGRSGRNREKIMQCCAIFGN